MDDIQDSSELRRGVPSSYTIYGAPPSMNASAYVMTDVTHRVHNVFRDANVLLTFVKYVKFIHMSQGMDLYYRDIQCNKDDLKEANIPTEEEYNKILVYSKLGWLKFLATLNNFSIRKLLEPLIEPLTFHRNFVSEIQHFQNFVLSVSSV